MMTETVQKKPGRVKTLGVFILTIIIGYDLFILPDIFFGVTKINGGKIGNNSPASQSFKNRFQNIEDVNLQESFKWFSDSAYDGINNRPRSNDTEIKFIDWFLREKWNLGNKFDIELESILFACPSCQRRLIMLVEYGRKNGKTINIKFYSHPKVFKLGDVKKYNTN